MCLSRCKTAPRNFNALYPVLFAVQNCSTKFQCTLSCVFRGAKQLHETSMHFILCLSRCSFAPRNFNALYPVLFAAPRKLSFGKINFQFMECKLARVLLAGHDVQPVLLAHVLEHVALDNVELRRSGALIQLGLESFSTLLD